MDLVMRRVLRVSVVCLSLLAGHGDRVFGKPAAPWAGINPGHGTLLADPDTPPLPPARPWRWACRSRASGSTASAARSRVPRSPGATGTGPSMPSAKPGSRCGA